MPYITVFPRPTDRSPTLQRDRIELPYMGASEDAIRYGFNGAYFGLRQEIRNPDFVYELDDKMRARQSPVRRTDRAMMFVDQYLDQASSQFHDSVLPDIEAACELAATQARNEVVFTKASAARAYQDDDERHHRRRARKITTPKLNIMPSRGRRFSAAQNHVAAARDLSLRLVTYINEAQRKRIRRAIVDSITRGVNADDTGVRIANYVGLHPRWQAAVDNMHQSMIDRGISRSIARQRASDYADELLDKRGIMIARTELMRAMNDGRLAGWRDLADAGRIDPERTVKVWISAPTACDDCAELGMGGPGNEGDAGDGVQVEGIETPFQTPWGPMLMPPGHPHCRCTVNIISVKP